MKLSCQICTLVFIELYPWEIIILANYSHIYIYSVLEVYVIKLLFENITSFVSTNKLCDKHLKTILFSIQYILMSMNIMFYL